MTPTTRLSSGLTSWTDGRTNGHRIDSRLSARYGSSDGASDTAMTPVLSHKLKHNKSILALAFSADFLFAGTEGGEILVSSGWVIDVTMWLLILSGLQPQDLQAYGSHRRTQR
jgi:hypothetical protein